MSEERYGILTRQIKTVNTVIRLYFDHKPKCITYEKFRREEVVESPLVSSILTKNILTDQTMKFTGITYLFFVRNHEQNGVDVSARQSQSRIDETSTPRDIFSSFYVCREPCNK